MAGGGFHLIRHGERLTFAHSKRERERESFKEAGTNGSRARKYRSACKSMGRGGTGWIKTRVLGYGGGYAGVVRPPVASNVDELYP